MNKFFYQLNQPCIQYKFSVDRILTPRRSQKIIVTKIFRSFPIGFHIKTMYAHMLSLEKICHPLDAHLNVVLQVSPAIEHVGSSMTLKRIETGKHFKVI